MFLKLFVSTGIIHLDTIQIVSHTVRFQYKTLEIIRCVYSFLFLFAGQREFMKQSKDNIDLHPFILSYFKLSKCQRCGTLDYVMYSPLIGCLPNDTSCQHYFVLDSESFCYGVLCLLSASKWIWLLIADYQVMAP